MPRWRMNHSVVRCGCGALFAPVSRFVTQCVAGDRRQAEEVMEARKLEVVPRLNCAEEDRFNIDRAAFGARRPAPGEPWTAAQLQATLQDTGRLPRPRKPETAARWAARREVRKGSRLVSQNYGTALRPEPGAPFAGAWWVRTDGAPGHTLHLHEAAVGADIVANVRVSLRVDGKIVRAPDVPTYQSAEQCQRRWSYLANPPAPPEPFRY